MQDGIIAGNGNSRYLKTVAEALSLYPTYQDFIAALIAGTFPIDLNGINAAGWVQQGTALNKANLLADVTASSIGLGGDATPNSAFAKLKNEINTLNSEKSAAVFGTYTGDGVAERTIPLGFYPQALLLFLSDGSTHVYRGSSANQSYGGLALRNFPITVSGINGVELVSNGFVVRNAQYQTGYWHDVAHNKEGLTYYYIAFK